MRSRYILSLAIFSAALASAAYAQNPAPAAPTAAPTGTPQAASIATPDTVTPAAPATALAPAKALKPAPDAAPSTPTVLSFLEWKSLRVHEAQQKLEQMNKDNPAQVWQEGKTAAVDGRPDEQKLNFNVDVALQLNIQDYFSMYLKNLTDEEFKEATKKLSPDEVADLLLAYKNSMEKERKLPIKFSKNPKVNAKSKKTEI